MNTVDTLGMWLNLAPVFLFALSAFIFRVTGRTRRMGLYVWSWTGACLCALTLWHYNVIRSTWLPMFRGPRLNDIVLEYTFSIFLFVIFPILFSYHERRKEPRANKANAPVETASSGKM